jgi:O-antigen chain-terminating methyltransferase
MGKTKQRLRTSKATSVLRAGVYTFRLPNYVKFFETQISNLKKTTQGQSEAISTTQKVLEKFSEDLETVFKLQRTLDEKVNDIKHHLLTAKGQPAASLNKKTINATMADDPTNDRFYKNFEDRFRGNEAMIEQRLLEYLPYLKSLSPSVKKLPVLDIGCGRGEFLHVVTQAGFKAVGIDMNKSMVERAKSLGYEAHEDDALSYLLKQKSSSRAVISGFHLVEHIPFVSLLKIFEECYRVVHPDGFVLFETPNPNNLAVGASNFYMDPSHIKPIPPALLAFAMEIQGFHAEILELHPAKENIKHEDPVIEDMMRMMYGPVDYAVLASKKPFKLIAK